MAKSNPLDRLYAAIDNYYQHNPDTLMPLLMLALSANGQLSISTSGKKPSYAACTLVPSEIKDYDWVKLNPQLKSNVENWIKNGVDYVCADMNLSNNLLPIYETFKQNDEVTVVQEYHHRIGRLVEHHSDGVSAKAQCQYATYILAEELLAVPNDELVYSYLEVFNHILVNSGLQPKRDRLAVAKVLKALLDYDGKGLVYNPFAGCSIAGAMLGAGARYYGDGDKNDKIFAAARLLNYGVGISNLHFIQRDSTQWLSGETIDYVLSTYVGYVNGQSSFDFCLGRLLEDESFGGKYAGMVQPKEIFEKQTENWLEALRRDWVSAIVLMPFGEVAVLIDAHKDKCIKSRISFLNFTHPMSGPRYERAIQYRCGPLLRLSDVRKKNYLRQFVVQKIKEIDGFEIVRLRDFVSKIKRQSYSSLQFKEDKRVMAYINRNIPYDKYSEWMQGIEKKHCDYIFSPCYRLTKDSLIVNKTGSLEPRIFSCIKDSVFFEDGFAFKFRPEVKISVIDWLLRELNEQYVQLQLHPYGMDEMVPESVTEEQILNLKLYRWIEEENVKNAKYCHLPCGYELTGNKAVYTIHDFLGNGSFGYAYNAKSKNLVNDEEKEVVLKEFYPEGYSCREGSDFKVVFDQSSSDDIDVDKKKFCDEAEIMKKLGNMPDSHIVPVEEFFESEKTGTLYYVMPYYRNGSLEDLQKQNKIFTEQMLVDNVVVPLCKALHYAHNANVLHLDIKPDNILVEDDGNAILIDFGVAKQYDANGFIVNRQGCRSGSPFSAPEVRNADPGSIMVKFGSEPDIYSLAATLYNLVTYRRPHSIQYNSDEDEDLRSYMQEHNLSDQFIDAIIAGLQSAATSRPCNAQGFLNLFPGCENIKLK